jgi:hypothetical protein
MIPAVLTTVEVSEVHRFSLEEHHQLIESGALEDIRVELPVHELLEAGAAAHQPLPRSN